MRAKTLKYSEKSPRFIKNKIQTWLKSKKPKHPQIQAKSAWIRPKVWFAWSEKPIDGWQGIECDINTVMEDVKVFLGDFQGRKVAILKQLKATSYLSIIGQVLFC